MKDQMNQSTSSPVEGKRDPPPVLALVALNGVRPPVKLAVKSYMITNESERTD